MANDQAVNNASESKVVKESIISRISLMSLMIITATILLLCLIMNIGNYSIAVNEEIRISRTLVNVLSYIPYPGALLIILLIFLIWCLFIRVGIMKLIAYIISMIIIELGIALTISDLGLENETSFYLVNIHHIMPIQTRLDYLNLEMIECYNHSPIIHTIIESKLIDIKNYIERSVDILRLNEMNYRDIAYYARELFNESIQHNCMQNSIVYDVAVTGTWMFTAGAAAASLLLNKWDHIIQYINALNI